MRIIEPSELIINPDGSIFHLHLHPEQISDTIIMVGDPGRVETVSSFFSKKEFTVSNREFNTTTGLYNNKRITVVSTGIGTDNIDIVVNELDALANIDLKTRTVKETHKKLTLIRLGTSGALQPDIPLASNVLTEISVGFDGLLNFYANRDKVCELEMEQVFLKHTNWNSQCAKPYFTKSSERLVKLFESFTIKGLTISAPGFYGPQGRVLRLPLADATLNEKIESFRYNGKKIANFEMESSAINGLSKLMGHESVTICTIIANRVIKDATKDYKPAIKNLIEQTLNKISE
ncbi:MAG: nucleoside phosphorylase [Bacteroidales bacterium]|nr:nucleoside phosphorylase [Bacteroidales bacterium]